jgi:hypothetical protein
MNLNGILSDDLYRNYPKVLSKFIESKWNFIKIHFNYICRIMRTSLFHRQYLIYHEASLKFAKLFKLHNLTKQNYKM